MISVERLCRSYGDFKAVNNVSFEIGKGEVVGLLGHNGAGKTTIMKMLTGFLEPSSGTASVGGLDLREKRREIQRLVGYLPENCPVYPEMAVIDYLALQAGFHGVPESEQTAAIRDAIDRTALGPKAGDAISTLSRGYRQRVGVAQAILHKPKILILDEPTNGLDPTQIHQMRGLIRELAKNATVVLSTHILQEVQAVCDRVLIIRAGELALDSRIDEIGQGDRLIVETDADEPRVKQGLSKLEGLAAVDALESDGGIHRYAISGAVQAPALARAMHAAGLDIHALGSERHDLETVFRELNEAGALIQQASYTAAQVARQQEAAHV